MSAERDVAAVSAEAMPGRRRQGHRRDPVEVQALFRRCSVSLDRREAPEESPTPTPDLTVREGCRGGRPGYKIVSCHAPRIRWIPGQAAKG
jgi:hypothetical protein